MLIEPAKVFFLNNAINHGVLTPLGLQEAAEQGKSVLFLLEANPGPGLGLLLAFTFFGKGVAKATAPGAAIIQFFGGIHEIYFPYVLMKPKLILAMIAGGMTGVCDQRRVRRGPGGAGRPGSIFAVYAQTARGGYLGVTLAVFGCGRRLLRGRVVPAQDGAGWRRRGRPRRSHRADGGQQGQEASVARALAGQPAQHQGEIHSIVFACDAGMGSSAMGASVLRKKIQGAGFNDVTVVNKAISNLTTTTTSWSPTRTSRTGRASGRVGDPRVGRELHGQPALRRDRRPAPADQR